jgi:hypothetical protein
MTARACAVKVLHAAEREDSSSTGGGDGPHVGRWSSRESKEGSSLPREQAAFIETHFLTPAGRDRRRLVGLVLYAAA